MNPEDDGFYVGYQRRAPASVARFLKPRVAALFVLALLVATLLVLSQGRFAQSFFEFGNTRSFSGVVSEFPYPTLLVERPGDSNALPYSRYLLVKFGKRGAAEAVKGLSGRHVTLRGTLIYRDDQTMIEVLADSVEASDESQEVEAPVAVGRYTLRGEIVDSKCYLGVMKPGNLKPHRACAIRCISGGIPPVFVVRSESGETAYLLLSGADGRAVNKEVLDMIAEPLEISGDVLRAGSDLILRAEPLQFRRLDRS